MVIRDFVNAGFRGQVICGESMSRHTSWRVGGKATMFYLPEDIDDLAVLLLEVPDNDDIMWLGLGSNLLVRDGGLDKHVICTSQMRKNLSVESSGMVIADAGVSCAKVARFFVKNSLTGGGFLAGIPGTIGGALAMNAGAFGGETWDLVNQVELINRQGQRILKDRNQFSVSYRNVDLSSGEWFIRAYFQLKSGKNNDDEINIKRLLKKRSEMQPIGMPSCGSVFRNPENDYAGRLIEASGLKGFSIGGAYISDKHANFIINDGNATARDIETLIYHARDKVLVDHGVSLVPEVKIVGLPFQD